MTRISVICLFLISLLPVCQAGNCPCDDCPLDPNPANLDLDALIYRPQFEIPDDARVGEILIFRQNIYPARNEDQPWYEKAVNYLNPLSHTSAIRAELQFRSGDHFDAELLEISERRLRRKSYLYNARVFPLRVCDGNVDVAVVTRDLWTFLPALSFTRSGGENRTIVGFSDVNFLGTGKTVFVNRQEDDERTKYLAGYFDPNLFQSRWQIGGRLATTSDGELQSLSLSRPFAEREALYAYSFSARHEVFEDPLYFRNETVEEFKHETRRASVSIGSEEYSDDVVERRVFLGISYDQHKFSESDSTQGDLPEDRTQSYPWLAWSWDNSSFVQTFNVNQNQQVEDIATGLRYFASLGYSSQVTGGHRDQLVFSGATRYRQAGERSLYSIALNGATAWDTGWQRTENLQVSLLTRGWLFNPRRDESWYTSFEFTYSQNLTKDRQLVLGGATGLRGYPSNYQVGDRRFVATLEKRFYWPWYPFRTFRVGGVVFMDTGRAWFENQDNGINGGVLMDAGLGLRVTSSRFQVTRVVHIDLAFPLNREDADTDRLQFIIKGEQFF